MKIFKLRPMHTEKLQKFCNECEKLGWLNNRYHRLNFDKLAENNGAYFAIEENGDIVSIAGCYRFIEYDPKGWRIFYRSATLPRRAKNVGLHRGTGPRGRQYINAFLDYTDNGLLYFTTNVSNDEYDSITRYHKHMLKESSLPDSYVDYCETINLLDTEQAIWKLDNEKYYKRTH